MCDALDPSTLDKEGQDYEERLSARQLLAEVRGNYPKEGVSHIEIYLSEIQDIVAILERQKALGVESPVHITSQGNKYSAEAALLVLKKIKESIYDILSVKIDTLEHHRDFIKAIHKRLRSGRERSGSTINYFVLNYDTLLEDALALEKISFTDGFIGGSTAWWEPTRLSLVEHDPFDLQARIFKLHGSIDWIKPEGSDMPLRVRSALPRQEIVGDGEPVVIYPANIKYREAQNDPYAFLLQNFRHFLRHSEDHVLCVAGYSFGDEHINVEIEQALKKNEGLSIVAFVGEIELPTKLMAWLKDSSINSQIQVFGQRAVWKEGKQVLSSVDDGTEEGAQDFEWYRFEYLSNLLSGKGA